jgi:4-amino-4-deoxy-L-arabinose transferase-like glycosyltransferase
MSQDVNVRATSAQPPVESETAHPAGTAQRLIQLVLIPVLLFFANWIPRVAGLGVFVTADEYDWMQRTMNLTSALARRSWVETFQYEHPAVTTLWLGALGVLQQAPAFIQKALIDPEPYKRPLEFWTMTELGVTPLQLLVAGRWWVVLAIALTTTIAYFPLRRLAGTAVAVVGLLFIAWSPVAVGFARQLQPDGLVASTTFAALAFFLGWLYGGRRTRDLVISGNLMGLGWLTKTPAGFLVPIGAILIAVELIRQSRRRDKTEHGAQSPGSWRVLVFGYVGWGIVATATFFLLWPAMWVDPVGTFGKMYARMVEYSAGHTNPNYFFGQALYDPGPIFYPVAYLFRITPAVLIGLAAAVVAAWRRYPPLARKDARWAAFGLLVFALLFTGLMTVIGKKFDRYLLPAFLPLDVLAGMGWVAMAYGIVGWIRRRFGGAGDTGAARRWAVGATVAVLALGLVALHGIFTARTYPYYITYYNPLLGGSRTAEEVMFVGWGEGLEEAAAWLNEQPNAENLNVISWYAEGPLSYYFKGNKITVAYGSRMPWLDVDYVVLYINQIQRDIPTKTVVDYFLRETPVFEAVRDGFVLARVYDMHAILDRLAAAAPPAQEVPVAADAGATWPDLELAGLHTLPETGLPAALPVELSFAGNVGGERKASLRLVSADGTLVAQRDVPLAAEVAVQLYVPPDAVPGPYDLWLLVYDGETMDPLLTTQGVDLTKLTTLNVGTTPR